MPEIHGRIVVLGASGFVGSHVVARARNAGWEVVALASSDIDLANPGSNQALVAVLQDGDICNIDITAFIGGVHGDTNATFLVGEVPDEARLLVERTHEATMRGINAVAPGRPLNVIGRVIESFARRFGYGVVRDFTGHGIGTSFHSGLIVPHYDDTRFDTILEPGMTFTIEPMLTLGTHEYDMWDDGWTVVTKDRKLSAQFEHTLLVTDTGSEILTLPG